MDPKPVIVPSKTERMRDDLEMRGIEAYAMPSSTYVPNDSHCFVVSLDRKDCWRNYGRCWNDKGEKIRVAQTNAYWQWLNDFCPPLNYQKCGINFGINGVCHTYANRELLIGEDEVDVRKAMKNHVCVSIFGKYGFGLAQLKQLLKDSFLRTQKLVIMDDSLLDTVLKRVDNFLDDEVDAWYKVFLEYVAIISVVLDNPIAQKAMKEMIIELVEFREALYLKFLAKEYNEAQFKQAIRTLLDSKGKAFLNTLRTTDLIDDIALKKYIMNYNNYLTLVFKAFDAQERQIMKTGSLDENMFKK